MHKQKNKPSQFSPCQGRGRTGFTLVELIVVITILSILGTIAFISLQGYSSDARDSTRISDLSSMNTSLEIFQLDAGKYPLPSDITEITYSGALAWSQGTFGETVYANVDKLDKIPTDPKTDKEYVYSTTSARNEYQLVGAFESDFISFSPAASSPMTRGELRGVYAVEKTARAKITGTYNAKLLKVSSGSTTYILAVPSIITSSGTTVDGIITNSYLAYNGYKNLPYQFAGNYNTKGETALNLVNLSDILVYSGDISILSKSDSSGILARKTMLQKLQNAYSGSTIKSVGEIAQLLNTDINDSTQTEYVTTNMIRNNLGGSINVSSSSSSSSTSSTGGPSNSCATQPVYTHTTFTAGTPTSVDQAWQNTSSGNPCYYECTDGYSGSDCSVAPSCATQPVYTHATFTTGTPTSASQAWQNSNGSNPCYYTCTGGYTGSDCGTPPAYTACTGTNQIKYQISGVVGTVSTGIACSDNIVICTGNQTGYIMSACNVGAITPGTSGVDTYGKYFQWGNNTGEYASITPSTTATPVDTTGFGPGNYYSSAIFIKQVNWSSPINNNLWGYTDYIAGGSTDKSLLQGPCGTGYHVPTAAEWLAIHTAGGWGTNGPNVRTALLLPFGGDRDYTNGSMRYQTNVYGHYWSSTPYNSTIAYHFNFGTSSNYVSANDITYGQYGRGYNVRCLKN